MATEVFLISESWVKEHTDLDDNIPSKYISTSIREAQEIKLKRILGDTLLAKLKSEVGNGTIAGAYKTLVNECRWFLAYTIVVDVIMKVSLKITPSGVVTTGDENVSNVPFANLVKFQAYYQTKADASTKDLQNFILNHRSDYPELSKGEYHRIHRNLLSAASCGINLSGARGKKVGRNKCFDK